MSYDILFQQALNMHEQGNLDGAERIYRQILETAPKNPDLLNLLGLVAQAKGIHEEAINLFYRAIKETPKYAPLYFNLAVSLTSWGKPYEAIDAYNTALNLDKSITQAYNNIADIYKDLGNTEKAKEYYLKALEIDNDFFDARANFAYISKDYSSLETINTTIAWYYLSLLYQEQGKFETALDYALKTEEYNQIADLYLIMHDYINAEKYLKLALEVNPYSVSALINLANIEINRNEFEEAEKKYKKAINLAPQSFDAHLNYANLLYKSNRPHEALEEYRKAVIIAPDIPEVSNNIAIILRDFNDLEQALDLFFNAFIKDPKNNEYAINISETLALLVHDGKKDKAIIIAEKWVNLSPDNEFAKHSLASLKGEKNIDNANYNKILFEHFANFYEQILEKIKYELPSKISELSGEVNGKILDLGCGTGLLGEKIKNENNYLIGIDISLNMLSKAEEKNVYDELVCEDILKYLEDNNDFDWAFAADVFGYIGDLDKIISLCRDKKICFSVELNENEGFNLTETGRYKHSKKYVLNLLEKYGFSNVSYHMIDLRLENNEPVKGLIFIVKK